MGGFIYGCSVRVDTHTDTHTLSQDERALTLPANMILQPWVEGVVEGRMRTKGGKPLNLQVPAVKAQPWSSTHFSHFWRKSEERRVNLCKNVQWFYKYKRNYNFLFFFFTTLTQAKKT